MQTFHNFDTGIAVKIEGIVDGYGGHKLTHVSFDNYTPDNHVIEVRVYPAGKMGDAIAYARLCVADVIPPGTFMAVG